MSENPIVAEAVALQEQSAILRKTVEWQSEQIQKICAVDTEMMTEQEKRKNLNQVLEILGRTKQSVAELLKVDAKTHELREKLNTHYGFNLPPTYRYSWADFPFVPNEG